MGVRGKLARKLLVHRLEGEFSPQPREASMITIQLDGLKAIDHWLESMVEAIDDLQHHGIPGTN